MSRRVRAISPVRTWQRASKTTARARDGFTYLHLPLQHKRNTRRVVTEWKFPRKQNYLDKHGSSIYQLHRSCAKRSYLIGRFFSKQPTSRGTIHELYQHRRDTRDWRACSFLHTSFAANFPESENSGKISGTKILSRINRERAINNFSSIKYDRCDYLIPENTMHT